jgi:hypothetical protein
MIHIREQLPMRKGPAPVSFPRCRTWNRPRGWRAAVTLVECLIAIGIIGLLLGILWPAVQAAREAARRANCQNNLRQIALAFSLHEDSQGVWPSGGWGWRWHGDPDRGFGVRQPGGWAFNVLPFLDQAALREKGAGAPPGVKKAEARAMAETPLEIFICPSRRAVAAYPFLSTPGFWNMDTPTVTARGDYAANAGDQEPGLYGPGPSSLAEGDSPGYTWPKSLNTGICFRRSRMRTTDVRDGASYTYLVAEGYLDAAQYTTGEATNDDQGLYAGYDRDTLRVTHPAYPPLPDLPGHSSDHSFGSAHPAGFQAALCDGSVRTIPYTVDTEVHRRLGNRRDRKVVQLP